MLNFSLIVTATLAGLAGGSHCIGMCGGIASVLAKPAGNGKIIPITSFIAPEPVRWFSLIQLHLGRLFTYAMAGALAGSLGAAGLLLTPLMPVQLLLFYVGNLSLIYLGLRCLGYRLSLPAKVGELLRLNRISALFVGVSLPASPFARGVLWGFLPCGLVYGVLPIALVSGASWSGALLMFCFGLGTLPYLLFAQGLMRHSGRNTASSKLAMCAAIVLITLGMLGLFLPNGHHDAGWWC